MAHITGRSCVITRCVSISRGTVTGRMTAGITATKSTVPVSSQAYH